jgi:hypothetical protein
MEKNNNIDILKKGLEEVETNIKKNNHAYALGALIAVVEYYIKKEE